MNCKYCNTYNPDGNRFCSNCGAPLEAREENARAESPFDGERRQNAESGQFGENPPFVGNTYEAPGYSQPYSPLQGEKQLKNTGPIISIILNIVFFNIIGLIFAILSLTNFNDYESALRHGNFGLAKDHGEKSKRYSRIANIFAIVCAVISVLSIIAVFVFTAFVAVKEGENIPYEDAFYEFEQFAAIMFSK